MIAAALNEARGVVARGWCAPTTSDKEMDATLAEAIAVQVAPIIQQRDAWIELVRELHASLEAAESALAEARKVPALEVSPELCAQLRESAEYRIGKGDRSVGMLPEELLALLRDIATLIQHITGGENA